MGGQIARPRARGGDVHKAEERGRQRRVARQQLHPAVLERAGAAAAGVRLAGGDLPAERAHARLAVRSRRGAGAGAGGSERRHSRRDAMPSTSSVTIVTRPEFLRRLFNLGTNARDRVPRCRTARAGRAARPDPGRGRAADRADRASASAAPTSRSSRARSPTSGWGSPSTRSSRATSGRATVVDVGAGVTGFAPGDRVVGEVAIGCGVCVRCLAGRAHLCARRTETGIVHMDGAMASRMVFPAALRPPRRVRAARRRAGRADLASRCTRSAAGDVAGQRVLVVGAGPIGLLAAQCARAEGAASVVVTDTPRGPADARRRAGLRRVARAAGGGRAGSTSRCSAPAAPRRSSSAFDGRAARAGPSSPRPVRRADDPVRLGRHGRPRHRPDRRARLGRLLAGRDRADHERPGEDRAAGHAAPTRSSAPATRSSSSSARAR